MDLHFFPTHYSYILKWNSSEEEAAFSHDAQGNIGRPNNFQQNSYKQEPMYESHKKKYNFVFFSYSKIHIYYIIMNSICLAMNR